MPHNLRQQDIIIKAAAVADYRPASVSDEKIKKADNDLSIALERTEDTLQYLGSHKPEGQILCGFAMETSDLENRARAKLHKKNLNMIVANNVKVAGAGFGTDTNVVTFITKDSTQQLEIMSKAYYRAYREWTDGSITGRCAKCGYEQTARIGRGRGWDAAATLLAAEWGKK